MNKAVLCKPISSILKSLCDNISERLARVANSFIFSLNTARILPLVSLGERIVLEALI